MNCEHTRIKGSQQVIHPISLSSFQCEKKNDIFTAAELLSEHGTSPATMQFFSLRFCMYQVSEVSADRLRITGLVLCFPFLIPNSPWLPFLLVYFFSSSQSFCPAWLDSGYFYSKSVVFGRFTSIDWFSLNNPINLHNLDLYPTLSSEKIRKIRSLCKCPPFHCG